MKTACSSSSFAGAFENRSLDLFGFLELAGELGLDGIECRSEAFPSVSPRFIRELLLLTAHASARISAVAVANDFAFPDETERKNQCEDVTRWTDVCRELGVPVLCTRTGSLARGIGERQAAQWVRSCYETVLPAAERAGVTLAVRNDLEVSSTPDELVELVMHFGSSSLQLACDPAALPAGDACGTLRKLMRLSVNAYLGLTDTDAGGTGFTCEAAMLLDACRRASYQGYLTLEYSGGKDPAEVVRGALRSLRSMMPAGAYER